MSILRIQAAIVIVAGGLLALFLTDTFVTDLSVPTVLVALLALLGVGRLVQGPIRVGR